MSRGSQAGGPVGNGAMTDKFGGNGFRRSASGDSDELDLAPLSDDTRRGRSSYDADGS